MERWDIGDIGCGQLAFELKGRLERLAPGERLEIIARSPGAATDLPAWCRITGHRLISWDHPVYVIERKGDDASSRTEAPKCPRSSPS